MKKQNHYISPKVLCPFYISEGGNKIVCEGIKDKTTIHMTFDIGKTRDQYKDDHCCSYYMKCIWAQTLCEKKYKEK